MNLLDRCDRCIALCHELYAVVNGKNSDENMSAADREAVRRIHAEYASLIGPIEIVAEQLPDGVRYFHGEPAPHGDLLTYPLSVNDRCGCGHVQKDTTELLERIKRRVITTSADVPPTVWSPFTVGPINRDESTVAVMMPFTGFDTVYKTIRMACDDSKLQAVRADDIWENATFMQDIVNLLCRARIVVADFTGRNPNVFYEVGIAHAVGTPVVPIVQSLMDVPSDLRHHRVLQYLPNKTGLTQLRKGLCERLTTVRRSLT
jgi:hypothetical protein